MAFGGLVKTGRTSVSVSNATFTADLGSNPTSGNLLLVAVACSAGSTTVSTAPPGFTLLHYSGGSGSAAWVWYYKVSVGTEQTASLTWSSSETGVINYAEYEWDGSAPTVTKNENTTNISTAVNSQASGAATPTETTNLCIALHGTDGNSLSDGGQAVDGSWVEDILFTSEGSQRAEAKLSSLVNATGSQEATHSDTDTGNEMYGAIAVFDSASAPTGNPATTAYDYWAAITPLVDPDVNPDGTIYYVSPTGSDSNAGTKASPYLTVEKAMTVVAPGDIIYLRDGTHDLHLTNVIGLLINGPNGTQANPIKLWAYPGESPVFEPQAPTVTTTGIRVTADYWHIKGIEVTGVTQKVSGNWVLGFHAYNAIGCVFEEMNVHHNGGVGIYIGGNSDENLLVNCDSHHNADPYTSGYPYGNADGVHVRVEVTGTFNQLRGVRCWNNSDDGYDTWYSSGLVLFEECWAFWNGYAEGTTTERADGNGIKLGPYTDFGTAPDYINPLRIVTNCMSFQNRTRGFDQNQGDMLMHLYNNTSYDNRQYGWRFYDTGDAEITNNISLDDANNDIAARHDDTYNTWNAGFSVSSADFVSISPTGANGARQSDGSLPDLDFMKLSASSDLVDAGTDVGLTYVGTAPDLGAYEKQETTDTTPDAFAFTDLTDQDVSTVYESNIETITGINSSTTVILTTTDGMEWRKNGGTYQSASGTVVNGDTVQLRVTSSASNATAVTGTLDIGGVTDQWSVTTEPSPDNTPDQFYFTDLINQTVSTVIESDIETITGISSSTTVTLTTTDGMEWRKNGGAYQSASGSVVDGDTVQLRVTSSSSNETAVTGTLDIGGVSDEWSVTTEADPDTVPNTFDFTSVLNQLRLDIVESNIETITGINASTPISISTTDGMEYRINGGSWTSTAGNVVNGDTVQLRVTTSEFYSTSVEGTINIGGVTDVWEVTTRDLEESTEITGIRTHGSKLTGEKIEGVKL